MARPHIQRHRHLETVAGLLERHPVVAILGARQVGKTTLAGEVAARRDGEATRFDLEDPEDLRRLEDAKLALQDLRGLVVIDEVQRRPDLFPVLRVLADRPDLPARFLILGSASPAFLKQSSETLAGRNVYHELDGFALDEVGPRNLSDLWLRGGFPRSYLATGDAESMEWRRAFIRTFLERDLPQLGVGIPAPTLHRFWSMVAHYHGQTWNGSELARALDVSQPTVRRYLDLLTAALVVRQLPPWFENIGKRQVKSPKVYIGDSGLFHTLLDLATRRDLDRHPKVGASWEGFALGEVAARLGAFPEECFFWATHSGAELDLLVVRGTRRLGFELKRTTTPRLTASMRTALDDLQLNRLDLIHAGEKTFPLAERVRALPLQRVWHDLEPLD
jgi:predicted AAA+ superfamily ATPase